MAFYFIVRQTVYFHQLSYLLWRGNCFSKLNINKLNKFKVKLQIFDEGSLVLLDIHFQFYFELVYQNVQL